MNTKQTIEGYITLAGLTVPKFIKLMGWSRSTYDRRMARPDTLTRGEIRRADYLLGFPDEIVVKLARSKQ